MLPLALLAGGLATRMYPLTQHIPKSLIKVGGEAFIIHQLRYVQSQGIEDVVICIGHLGERIQALVGSGEMFNLRVRYSNDGESLLGTGGALKKALPLLGENFFIHYGDSFLPISFSAVEQAYTMSGKAALMTLLKNENQWDKSNVLFSDGHIKSYNKRAPRADMAYIDYGLSVVSASIFRCIPEHLPFDLSDLYQNLADRGYLAGYEVKERFYEIGSPQGFEEAERYFKQKR